MAESHRHGTDEVTCRQFVELVTEYWEGALSEEQTELVEEHLVLCDPCKLYLEQMQATVETMREAHDVEPMPAGTEEALLSAYRAWRGEA